MMQGMSARLRLGWMPALLLVAAGALAAGCTPGAPAAATLPGGTAPARATATAGLAATDTPPPTTAAPSSAIVMSTQLADLVPLCDMGAGQRYKGEDGGLYGGGRNAPPPAHAALAQAALARVQPLDKNGQPAPNGKVALISIGMSNTTMEFSLFRQMVIDNPAVRSPRLTVVDGAQGGQTARIWATQEQPWQVLAQRLQEGNVTPPQVQVVWLKQADAQPKGDFQATAGALRDELAVIVQRVQQSYPNVRLVYLSSRIYAGYAKTALNPEPYAYEGAFAVRWLIQRQMAGDMSLNCDPARGAVAAPVLLWGPYLWANGTTPRRDGLTWETEDFSPSDGTHPSPSADRKVADMLLGFFTTNELARSWFVGVSP